LYLLASALALACADPAGPSAGNRVIWHAPGGSFYTPAVDGSTVFFPTDDHQVIAFDAETGVQRWAVGHSSASGEPLGENAVVAAGVVAVPDGDIFAFDESTGTLRWVFHPAVGGGPGRFNLATDGKIVFSGSASGYAYAVDAASGSQIWATRIATDDTFTNVVDPAFSDDLVIVTYTRFTAPVTGGVAAIDRPTGALRWRREFSSARQFAGSAANGRVVFWRGSAEDLVIAAVDDGRLYGLDRETGSIVWTTAIPPETGAGLWRPLAVAGNTVVAGPNEGGIMGYDPATGAAKWTLNVKSTSTLREFVSDSTTVYLTPTIGDVVAVNAATGKIVWQAYPSERSFSAPPATGDDLLFVSGLAGYYAIKK